MHDRITIEVIHAALLALSLLCLSWRTTLVLRAA